MGSNNLYYNLALSVSKVTEFRVEIMFHLARSLSLASNFLLPIEYRLLDTQDVMRQDGIEIGK